MRGIVLAALISMFGCSPGFGPFDPARATRPPLCSPIGDLGSVHLDYNVAPPASLSVSAAEAEQAARTAMGLSNTATTCSVRLARYDNISVHLPTVWVVHFDGLAIPGLGGSLLNRDPNASPPLMRRMLVIVSTDTPTLLLSIGMGE